jgi:hypothetical protein
MNIQKGQTYRTRNGSQVEILKTDCDGPYPVLGYMKKVTHGYQEEKLIRYDRNGVFILGGISDYDLVPNVTKKTKWVRVLQRIEDRSIHFGGSLYANEKDARFQADNSTYKLLDVIPVELVYEEK